LVFEIIRFAVEFGMGDGAWVDGVPFSDPRDVWYVWVVVMAVCNNYSIEY